MILDFEIAKQELLKLMNEKYKLVDKNYEKILNELENINITNFLQDKSVYIFY